MKIKLYFGQEDSIKKSGIGRAFVHQKRALELNGIAYNLRKYHNKKHKNRNSIVS